MVYRADRPLTQGPKSPVYRKRAVFARTRVSGMIESPVLVWIAACAIGCYVCWTVHKASSLFGRPALWDWAAPIGSLVGLALLLPMTISRATAATAVSATSPAAVVRNSLTMWLLLTGLTLIVTIGIEINELLERPDGVAELDERMPDWLIRGLTGTDQIGGSQQ